MNHCGGDILLALFERYGIEYVFCSPGSEWVAVWEGLARCRQEGRTTVKYINCRHESLAVTMAMGYAMVTGKVPAVLLHTGLGALNAAMPIRMAYNTHIPLMIFSAEDAAHGDDAGEIKGPGPHWVSQLSDFGGPAELVRRYVKWSNTVRSRMTMLDSFHRGYEIALSAPRGPVFLGVARDLLVKPMSPLPAGAGPVTGQDASCTGTEPRDLAEAARLLVASQEPVIITEYAGANPRAVDKLTELAETLSIPVFQSIYPSACSFPREHPLFLGYNSAEALAEADTVLVAGSVTPWYPPTAFPQNGARVILLDEDTRHEQLPYWNYHVDIALQSPLEQGLEALTDAVREQLPGEKAAGGGIAARRERWQRKHDELLARWEQEALAGQKESPLSPRWFFRALQGLMPADTLFLEESVTHSQLVQQNLASPGHYRRVHSGGLGTGFGMACGAKLALPETPVVFFVGDGSFNYSPALAGLGVCQEYHLPLFTVIADNRCYQAMRHGIHSYFPEGCSVNQGKYYGVDIVPTPDYAALAPAFEAHGEKVEKPEDIRPAVERAWQQVGRGKAVLLDAILSA
ncbi:MAG: thiamine pyrophosphate-binding protein [Chloroflexota bacterium]